MVSYFKTPLVNVPFGTEIDYMKELGVFVYIMYTIYLTGEGRPVSLKSQISNIIYVA